MSFLIELFLKLKLEYQKTNKLIFIAYMTIVVIVIMLLLYNIIGVYLN